MDTVRLRFSIVLVAALMCLFPAAALAYVDPGTGSFVIQGVIAAVVGAGIAFKMFWHRIKGMFGGRTPPPEDDLDDD